MDHNHKIIQWGLGKQVYKFYKTISLYLLDNIFHLSIPKLSLDIQLIYAFYHPDCICSLYYNFHYKINYGTVLTLLIKFLKHKDNSIHLLL